MESSLLAFIKEPNYFTIHSNIIEFCKPLEKKLDIAMFCYHKIFRDGSEVMLSNNIAWVNHFHSNGFLMGRFVGSILGNDEFSHAIWPLTNNAELLSSARNICQMYHGITLRLVTDEYYELFGFGVRSDSSDAINTLVNNIDFFESFSSQFKYQAADLIEKCSSNKIVAVNYSTSLSKEKNKLQLDNRYYLGPEFKNVYLTFRETECAYYLAKGKTAKEIANTLNISSKTVEYYIEIIKRKLDCYKKSDLIEKILLNDTHLEIFVKGIK